MKTNSQARSGPAAAGPAEWALFALLVLLGGSSFTFIHAAIETAPPAVVTVGRLWIAAAALYLVMRVKGRRFPTFLVRTNNGLRPRRLWGWMTAVGFIGYAIPFLIFPWAQQYVESGLAGVYMAFMPLWTLGLATAFADDRLNSARIAGFGLGFVGVVVLTGQEALAGLKGSAFLAQAGLLLATFLYAASAVISRRAPTAPPSVFSAGSVLMGAIFATPALLFSAVDPAQWSAKSIASIVILGLGPTGLAGIVIVMIIRRAGAAFMALANYLTPLVAVFLGALIYQERLQPNVYIALGFILAGVALSQRKSAPSGN